MVQSNTALYNANLIGFHNQQEMAWFGYLIQTKYNYKFWTSGYYDAGYGGFKMVNMDGSTTVVTANMLCGGGQPASSGATSLYYDGTRGCLQSAKPSATSYYMAYVGDNYTINNSFF